LTAFPQMAKYFGVTPSLIAQSIGYSLLGIAVGPIFYNPLSRTIGRRPTYLLGSALFIPCVIWLALSKDYAVFCAARFFAGFFSAFSQTVPPASIADIYPPERRGDKMSLYGVACLLAPAISPVIGGLVIEYQGGKWQIIYWIVLGFAGLQLLMFTFLVPETLWVEDPVTDQQPVQAMRVEDGKKTLNGQPIRSGKRGASWMPWHRPAEFGALAWSPIAMVGRLAIVS
jgi:multidrug resistance protein